MFWRRHPGLKVLFLLLLILVTLTVFVHNTLTPIFFSLAEAEAIRIANRAINEAINKESENIKYDDLIIYKMNKDGDIKLMQYNTRRINKFSSQVSLNIQDKLEEIKNMDVSIPVARILGIDLLSGMGPYLNVKIIPVGFVNPPLILDSFEAAGINQTRHKIYLQVDVKLKLIIPFSRKTIEVKSDVLVTEVTILGKVPEIYVGLNGEGISGIVKRAEK